jgi:Protein of unknown function (DUF3995)
VAEGLARPGGIRAGGQHAVELAAGGDAELGEHVAEVVLGGARPDEQPGAGRTGNPGIILAVWTAAVLKVIGAIVPLAAVGVTSGQATIAGRHRVRALAWLEATILTIYGLVLTVAGLLVQSGAIAPAARADRRALAWHAYLWDPWFLLWGALVTAALVRSRQHLRRAE